MNRPYRWIVLVSGLIAGSLGAAPEKQKATAPICPQTKQFQMGGYFYFDCSSNCPPTDHIFAGDSRDHTLGCNPNNTCIDPLIRLKETADVRTGTVPKTKKVTHPAPPDDEFSKLVVGSAEEVRIGLAKYGKRVYKVVKGANEHVTGIIAHEVTTTEKATKQLRRKPTEQDTFQTNAFGKEWEEVDTLLHEGDLPD